MSRTRNGMRLSKPSKSRCASMVVSSEVLIIRNSRTYENRRGGVSPPRLGFRGTGILPAVARAFPPSVVFSLHQPLVQHRISHLQEAADVGAVHQVAGRAVLLGRPEAVVVDRDHDLVQAIVDFGASPAQARAVLRHL